MSESNVAKILKIGIMGNDKIDFFNDFLNENVLQSVKFFPNFTLQTSIVIDENNASNNLSSNYNYVFFVTNLNKLNVPDTIDYIKKISKNMIDPRNHLFIIVDGCENLEINDDGDVIFSNENEYAIFHKFEESLSSNWDDKLFHICKISFTKTNIWKIISKDTSIINLTEDQINLLASSMVKKSSKMSVSDKKREIKLALKKINLDDKLAETGYNEFYDNIIQYFKIIHQKKVICQNYIHAFNQINIGLTNSDTDNIVNLLKEIYDISFLKTEMYDDLIEKIDNILITKFKQFCDKCKNNITINPTQINNIDAYTYHKFLTIFMDIAKGYNLSNIMEITKQEIEKTNSLIIEHHKKEVEKVTDLEKILSLLEIFADKDRNNLIGLFDKIKSHSKIIQENMEKMDNWILFVDKCLKLGIPKDSVIKLIEEIITSKFMFYSDIARANSKNISVIYPQCLHVFLLSNINKNFIFKKLFMFVSYSIRYSGRNIVDHIKNIKSEQFQNLLLLENKLLELCSVSVEEQSQPINLSDVDIVETFNENTIQTKQSKPTINNDSPGNGKEKKIIDKKFKEI